MMIVTCPWLETPRVGRRTQRDTAFRLLVINFGEIQSGTDVDDLCRTVQLGPLMKVRLDSFRLQFC